MQHIIKKFFTTSSYDEVIRDIANKHYHAQMQANSINTVIRPQLIEYMIKNESRVNDILKSIGYIYRTCTGYSAFSEVLSIIKCEPYIEHVVNERDLNDWNIEVSYYDYLLNSLVFGSKQHIKGVCYDTVFNVLTGKFRILDNDKIKLVLMTAKETKDGYSTLYFKVIFL